jgi:hypothetical protein
MRSGRVRIAPVQRHDSWWVEPLVIVLWLGAFVFYATWASLQNAYYYAAPYLSPFYSPCLAVNCQHVTLPLIGAWWTITPAIIIIGGPLLFRLTCYYYRKAYYRAFFWSPPACAVPDARSRYTGETRFPFILQNVHRYAFWLALIVLLFLWWDVIEAFQFPNGFGIGLGTLIMLANVVLLTSYSFSCHSLRHICGGALDVLSKAPARRTLWHWASRLNERHQLIAWCSLTSVALTDLYIRMVAMGMITDVRFF